MNERPMELFLREAPEVAEAFNTLIRAVAGSKGLDGKTKQLISIAMKTSAGDVTAMKAHIPWKKDESNRGGGFRCDTHDPEGIRNQGGCILPL